MTGEQGEVWLIRHGETEWSRSGQHTGRTDIPLNRAGEIRAVELRERLAEHSFARVLSSPLCRAKETCRLAGFADLAVVCDELREWDYGVYEGRTTSEIRRESRDWSVWSSPVPEGESIEQVAARARSVIGDVLKANGDVVLFSHGHFLRVLAACWIGLPPVDGRLLSLHTSSISVLGFERDTRVLLRWNQQV